MHSQHLQVEDWEKSQKRRVLFEEVKMKMRKNGGKQIGNSNVYFSNLHPLLPRLPLRHNTRCSQNAKQTNKFQNGVQTPNNFDLWIEKLLWLLRNTRKQHGSFIRKKNKGNNKVIVWGNQLARYNRLSIFENSKLQAFHQFACNENNPIKNKLKKTIKNEFEKEKKTQKEVIEGIATTKYLQN